MAAAASQIHSTRIAKPGGAFIHRTQPMVAASASSCARDASMLFEDHLGSIDSRTSDDQPVTWIRGEDHPEDATVACQSWSVVGGKTREISWNGRVVGCHHEDEEAEYLMLGGLLPSCPTASRPEQAADVLETIASILSANGMTTEHLMRTWFYLDRILDWYDAFNQVRNAFFLKHGIFDGLVPASTGIGCRNNGQSALVAKCMAIRPKRSAMPVAVNSPLQCPAFDYRSAFSRAVEVQLPSHRQLHVSGTASIGPEGNTIHAGDLNAQVRTTLTVVDAILQSRNYDWCHTTRAIAYVKHRQDLAAVAALLDDHPLRNAPLHVMQAEICRDDLLFELELDAFVPAGHESE